MNLHTTHPNKRKGNTFERRIVQLLQSFGFTAKRTWGSNGQSQGLAEEVDVYTIDSAGLPRWQFQCKSIKALPKWLGMSDEVDGVIFHEDRGEDYIMLPLEPFLELVYNWENGECSTRSTIDCEKSQGNPTASTGKQSKT